jgi:2-polyprenyl-3-methyl-5-hydroxy-6-metoxy-1,4-benzoquinol methylase
MSSTALTRLVYARLDELSTAADLDARLEFLCHGLLPNSGNPQAALLWAVLDGIALDGKHILDAGCGRGGALAAIAQRWRPAGLTGLDVSHEQIAACRRRFAAIKARWQVADMCSLPQPPSSQDVLLGVEVLEGLHTPSDFLKGAARVLKPGGLLVMADLMSPATAQLLIQHAADAGFTLQQQVDLSPGVGAAMAERSRPAGEAHFLRAVFRDETQAIERALANGELRYLALHLQRTTAPGQTRAWSVPPLRPAVPRVNHCASIDPPNAVFPYGVPSASGPLPVFAFAAGPRTWPQTCNFARCNCPVAKAFAATARCAPWMNGCTGAWRNWARILTALMRSTVTAWAANWRMNWPWPSPSRDAHRQPCGSPRPPRPTCR